MELTHGSLFSGIGGFDLAAEWMGWRNLFHCETDGFCNHVLNFYWPEAEPIKNIIGYEWKKWKGKIDVLSGGFPCQPFSNAGKRHGKADPRHLWPYMLDAIRQICPRWVVGENVRGLISWNEGLVFDEVQADLEAAGYEVFPVLLPAAGIGAPHQRERIWFIAHTNSDGDQFEKRTGNGQEMGLSPGNEQEDITTGKSGRTDHSSDQRRNIKEHGLADSDSSERLQGRMYKKRSPKAKRFAGQLHPWLLRDPWQDFPAQSPVCNGDDGLPGSLDGIAFSKWRRESLKAGGNAIVPQMALHLFKAIETSIRINLKTWKR